MNELKRCYLTAVISEDGTKVEQVCVSRYRYPLPTDRYAKPKLKQVNGKLKPRQPWETMGCNLTDTAMSLHAKKMKEMGNKITIEEWKDIPGYEGSYRISNLGRCYSMQKKTLLKEHKNGKGYAMVDLTKDGIIKHCRVHRLVAEAFLPKIDGLTEVNHIDENKSNNIASNLEWCDTKYNINYGLRTAKAKISEKATWKKKALNGEISNSKEVIRIDESDDTPRMKFKSIEAAARAVHGSSKRIADVCHGRARTAYGYRWEFTGGKGL